MDPEQTRFEILKSVFLDERVKELFKRVNDFTLGTGREAGFVVGYNYYSDEIDCSNVVEGDETSCPLVKARWQDWSAEPLLEVHSHPNSVVYHDYVRACQETRFSDLSKSDLIYLGWCYHNFIGKMYCRKASQEFKGKFIPPIGIRLYPFNRDHCDLFFHQFCAASPFEYTLPINAIANYDSAVDDFLERIIITESVEFNPEVGKYYELGRMLSQLRTFSKAYATDSELQKLDEELQKTYISFSLK